MRRLLHIDGARRAVALIDVADERAWPEWEDFVGLERALDTGRVRVRQDDPWFADTRPDAEISEAARRVRDARLEVILPLAAPDGDPDRPALHAGERGALVRAAHRATGRAEDKIYSWLRRYWQRGQIDNALLPDFARCGTPADGRQKAVGERKRGRPSKLAKADPSRAGMNVREADRQLLVRGGRRYWQKLVDGHRLTLPEAYQRTLETYFAKRLELRGGHLVPVIWEGPADDARLPTFRQFCYWLAKERRRDKDLVARYGQRVWALKHRPVLGSSEHLSSGPGDLFLIDATVADVQLLSARDPRWVIGRPVLYLVIDHFTRMIAGLYVGLEGPSWTGAMMALENALTEKVSFCASYGITIGEEEWPCHQLPRRMTADRGEMIGVPADALVPGFRIRVSNTPPFRADFKSFVEGQFKISNERGIRRLPGAVDKARDRGDPDYRLDARLTLRDFTRVMIELALHNNLRRRLETLLPRGYPLPPGMDPRPLDLWEWGIEHRLGCGREFPRERVRACLLPTVRAGVTREGLSVHDGLLHYSSATAREQGWFVQERGRRRRHVDLAVDDRDVSRAYLRLDRGRVIEECPLTDRDALRYAGMSLAEVLDERDRFDIARRANAGLKAQETAELNVKLAAITDDATRRRREALGDARPFVDGVRAARRIERELTRREEAFTRVPERGVVDESSDVGQPVDVPQSEASAGAQLSAPLPRATPAPLPAAPTTSTPATPSPGAPHLRLVADDDEYVPFPS